mgnify:CR=1 FL=1
MDPLGVAPPGVFGDAPKVVDAVAPGHPVPDGGEVHAHGGLGLGVLAGAAAVEVGHLAGKGRMDHLARGREKVDADVVVAPGLRHLEGGALVDGAVRLFDCIEFNASFRIMDSISEIAFLSMDMDARGYHKAARRLLNDYLEYNYC